MPSTIQSPRLTLAPGSALISRADSAAGAAFTQKLSLGLAVPPIAACGLGMVFWQ